MPPVGFEPTISAGDRPTTYTLDRAATEIGIMVILHNKIKKQLWQYISVRLKKLILSL